MYKSVLLVEFRICTNCKNVHYKVYKPLRKIVIVIICWFFFTNPFTGRVTYLW